MRRLRVPAILGVAIVASAITTTAACNSDDCHERCVPLHYRDADLSHYYDAAVVDAAVVDAISCPLEPDPQTGDCPRGCEPTACFT